MVSAADQHLNIRARFQIFSPVLLSAPSESEMLVFADRILDFLTCLQPSVVSFLPQQE